MKILVRFQYFQFVFLAAGDGHVRALQVVLVDDVVDSLALVSSNVLRVRVRQFLVVLYREVLSLYVFLEFLSFGMAFHRFLKAVFEFL